MQLESQVCSLELAKRLKELGVRQESYFYWSTDNGDKFFVDSEETYPIDAHYPRPKIVCAAFTVAELGEILFQINYFNLEKTGYLNITTEMIDRHEGYFYRLTNNFSENIIDDYKEADARARLLIYFLENGLIKNEPK